MILVPWVFGFFRRGEDVAAISRARTPGYVGQGVPRRAVGSEHQRAPWDLAMELVAPAGRHPATGRVEVTGPGFINLALDTAEMESAFDILAADLRPGTPWIGEGRTSVMDYASPNMAKPMYIAQIRSTRIGNALDRMRGFLGYRVIADDHCGD